MSVSVVEPNRDWGACHKRVPAVVSECVETASLAPSSGNSVRAYLAGRQGMSERLRRLTRCSRINKSEFQRDRCGISICVANGNFDSSAAIQCNESTKILMCLHTKRTPVCRVDIEHLRTALSFSRFRRWLDIRFPEKPVDAIKWNDQRLRMLIVHKSLVP